MGILKITYQNIRVRLKRTRRVQLGIHNTITYFPGLPAPPSLPEPTESPSGPNAASVERRLSINPQGGFPHTSHHSSRRGFFVEFYTPPTYWPFHGRPAADCKKRPMSCRFNSVTSFHVTFRVKCQSWESKSVLFLLFIFLFLAKLVNKGELWGTLNRGICFSNFYFWTILMLFHICWISQYLSSHSYLWQWPLKQPLKSTQSIRWTFLAAFRNSWVQWWLG